MAETNSQKPFCKQRDVPNKYAEFSKMLLQITVLPNIMIHIAVKEITYTNIDTIITADREKFNFHCNLLFIY